MPGLKRLGQDAAPDIARRANQQNSHEELRLSGSRTQILAGARPARQPGPRFITSVAQRGAKAVLSTYVSKTLETMPKLYPSRATR